MKKKDSRPRRGRAPRGESRGSGQALRLSQALLREREAELETIIAHTPFMVTRCSRELTYRFVSRAYAAMLRRSPAELVGRPIVEVMGQEGFESILPHVREVLDGRVVHYERAVHFAGVGTRDLSVVYTPESDGAGRVVGWVASILDVTERRRTEQALAASEQRFRTFMENSPALAWLKDEHGRYAFANRSFLAAFGLADGEVVGRSDAELFPAELAEEYRRNDLAVLRTGRPGELLETTAELDGEHRYISIKFPVPDASGRPLVGGMAVDVTRQTAAERALRESERRFRTMADSSPVMIWVTDTRGEIEFVNRAYREFFGVSEDELRAPGGWHPLVHPEDRESYVGAFLSAISQRAHFAAECRVRHADGGWRWIGSVGSPRFSDSGEFLGHVGSSPDISARRQAEEALREADRRKDEFMAVLAHELRNPLAPLRAGLEVLRVSEDKAAALERVRPLMERQVGHMMRLIDDLLDVSRITSGRIQLQRQPKAFAELVGAAVEASRATIEKAGLQLEVETTDEPCVVDVDPTRIVQVLSNLLDNAAKFTNPGGRVKIAARVEAEPGPPTLAISVSDTGIGLHPAAIPDVFHLFSQGDHGGRPRVGLGIGLALARQLMELHGGTIEATSDGPGQGSRFTVRLPVMALPRLLSERRAGRALPRIAGRVLIIDDNVDAAESLAMLVTALGGNALTATNGEAGVRCAQEFRPEAILLDIGMPGVDGYETCRRLRAEPAARGAFIVALTGWGQDQDRRRAAAEGFDAHVTKPADPAVLAELLASRGSSASAADGAGA